MDMTENQSTALLEGRTFEETTLLAVTEEGTVLKRRKRKSAGRRVSFANAPSLHIFPRDDAYETPTRGKAVDSPNSVGKRRSPRLASKRLDAESDDKENTPLPSSPAVHFWRRRAKKPFTHSVQAGDSPVLRPENWLDARPGNDDENSGPVDLRHLSFDAVDCDMDEDNMTLDSTTFNLKMSQLYSKSSGVAGDEDVHEEPAVVHLDKDDAEVEKDVTLDSTTFTVKLSRQENKSSDLVVDEVMRNEPAVVNVDNDSTDTGNADQPGRENDMSLTMIRSKPPERVIELPELEESNSDMTFTVQFPEDQRRSFLYTGGSRILDDQKLAVLLQKPENHGSLSSLSTSPLIHRPDLIVSTGGSRILDDQKLALLLQKPENHGSLSPLSTSPLIHRPDLIVSTMCPSPLVDRRDLIFSTLSASPLVDGRDLVVSTMSASPLVDCRDVIVSTVTASPLVDCRDVIVSTVTASPLVDCRDLVVSTLSSSPLVDRQDMSMSSLSSPLVGYEDRSITLGIPRLRDLVREEEENNSDMEISEVILTGVYRPREMHSEVQPLKTLKLMTDALSLEKKLDGSTPAKLRVCRESPMQDNLFKDTNDIQGNPTAQVPRLSELLAADMNSPNSVPARPDSSSWVVCSPSPLIPAGSNVVLISPMESGAGDSSMEIVGTTELGALHLGYVAQTNVSRDGGHVNNIADPDPSQVGAIIIATTELEGQTHFLTGLGTEPYMKDKVMTSPPCAVGIEQGIFTSLRQKGLSPFMRIAEGEHSDQYDLATRKTICPTHILKTCEIISGLEERQEGLLSILRTKEEDHSSQYDLSTRKTISPTHILKTSEIVSGLGEGQEGLLPIIRAEEEDYSSQCEFATRKTVSPTHILKSAEIASGLEERLSPFIGTEEEDHSSRCDLATRKTVRPTEMLKTSEIASGLKNRQEGSSPLKATHEGDHSPQYDLTTMKTASPAHILKTTEIINVNKQNDLECPQIGFKLEQVDPVLVQETNSLSTKSGADTDVHEISVEEFLKLAKMQLSSSHQKPREKDLSLTETFQVDSLTECLKFCFLTRPQILFMQHICQDLDNEVHQKRTSVAKLEEQLTTSNPAILSCFKKVVASENQHMIKHLGVPGCRLIPRRDWLKFRLRQEEDNRCNLVEIKYRMLAEVHELQEARNALEDTYQHFLRLQTILSSKMALVENTSKDKHEALNLADLERIEDLKERLRTFRSSAELKLAKSRARLQVSEDNARSRKQTLDQSRNCLLGLRTQVVDNVCMSQQNLIRTEVARDPYAYVKKIKDNVLLLQKLQDGWQLKSAGRENMDLNLELSYRSLLKRRYVVRKEGNAVNVLASSWALEPGDIEAMCPGVHALEAFHWALLKTTNDSLNSKNLRVSMQGTRIQVGNLMDLMDEVRKCQTVVNDSCGGGVLVEPRFLTQSDGQPQLELKFIDCFSSIKFSISLDMSCLTWNGYPYGALPAKVQIGYCAPPVRHLFKGDSLEGVLASVKPGFYRVGRICAAMGSLLASLRKGR